MRKVSEIKGEEALDVFADLIEPAAEIMGDKEIIKAYKEKSKAAAIKIAIKGHKQAVIAILAAIEGVKPEEYEVSLLSLPTRLLEVLNDPELVQLFT